MDDSLTIRQSICDNILARLKTISKSNGYYNDYKLVDEWKLSALKKEAYPAILLVDDTNIVTAYDRLKTDFNLRITVAILCQSEDAPSDLRKYIADVYQCIGVDITCDGLCFDIEPLGDVMNLQQQENVYGDVELKFNVIHNCKSWDLFNQI